MVITYMDESGCYQDTCAKVLAREEHLWGDVQPLDLLRGDWETSAQAREAQDQDYYSSQLKRGLDLL